MKLIKWPADGKSLEPFTYHWCPACEKLHVLPDTWARSGPDDAPTYVPSFRHTMRDDRICHYVITAGMIQFCPDSWHKREDIVPMPDIPDRVAANLTESVFND